MADIQAVLRALDALNKPADKAAFSAANAWLQDFQHSNEAWATCNILLLSADSPLLAKIFASQTFRTKVTYDLHQLDTSFLPSLRETLITALQSSSNGPKSIIIQLCLAVSGLALQFPAWQDTAVQDMVEKFGTNPATVPILLEFLTAFPEEISTNTRIPLSNEEFTEGARKLLTNNAERVLGLLVMYMTASGITTTIQSQIFYCLRSWIISGEIMASDVANSPLLAFAFEALTSEELFDAAVDVLCEIIHETQELDDNMKIIEIIVPRLLTLKPMILASKDDPDKVKGLARIFSEAGEVYRMLILQHPESFFPIVEAIGECAAFPDLEIVPITFQFWMRLAGSIGKKPSVSPLFAEAYRSLMIAMMKHLQYPEDPENMPPQEAEDFRSFRHVIGDTLKDCCVVLGTESCLASVLETLTAAIAAGRAGESIPWQNIEAPLFSLRSMGAEIDPTEDRVIPKIMDLMPLLPSHPRIRYSAILVISRYTPWTSRHPSYIPFQLQFVSSGFEEADSEVSAAATQAMLYLCLDCKNDMIPFLPQLHSFLITIGNKLLQEDRRRLYEAVAHVISAMPIQQAAQSLKTFSVDILAKIHTTLTKPIVTKQDLRDIGDGLENLESMLAIIETFGEDLPDGCASSCQEAWLIIDALLSKFGDQYDVVERSTRVIRAGLRFFGRSAAPVASSVLARMSLGFEAAGFASYAWISGKIISYFGEDNNSDMYAAVKDAYERSTSKMIALLQEQELRQIPDVVEDYLHMLIELFERRPDVLLESSIFPMAIRIAVVSLTLTPTEVIFAALDLLRGIIAHDCLDSSINNPPPKFPIYASAIRQVIASEGSQFTINLVAGVVNDFPAETVSMVITIFRLLAVLWPQQLLTWLPNALDSVSMPASYGPYKQQLLLDLTTSINSRQYDGVKKAIAAFQRSISRSKDRRRAAPLEQE